MPLLMPLLLLLLAASAGAEEDWSAPAWYTECQLYAEAAEKFQRNRQEGVPLGEMLERLRNALPGLPAGERAKTEQVGIVLISMAYQIPISSPDERERVITQFAEGEHLRCIKARGLK